LGGHRLRYHPASRLRWWASKRVYRD
jgi:hypothetical protein